MMTPRDSGRRPSRAARRAGYVLWAVVTAAIWFVLNVAPEWPAFGFLSDDFAQVLWLVNFYLIANIVVNLLYVVADPPWLRSLGDLVVTVTVLVLGIRVWQVFPFDFGDSSFWPVLFRVLLVIGIVISSIATVAQLVILVRLAIGKGSGDR